MTGVSKVNKFFLFLLIILQTDFFSLQPTWGMGLKLNSYTSKYIILVIVIVLLSINYKEIKNKFFLQRNTFKNSILLLIFSTLLIQVWSCFRYPQGLFATFSASYYFYIVLLYFFLMILVNDVTEVSKLFEAIGNVGVVWALILIVQDVALLRDISFLNIGKSTLLVEKGTKFLFFYRIKQPSDFITFALLALIARCFLKEKTKSSDWVKIGIIFSYIVAVSQTRLYMLLCLMMIIIFSLYKSNKLKRRIFSTAIFMVGSVILFNLWNIILEFTTGTRKLSFSVRLEAISFYLGEIPRWSLFGIGFPNTSETSYLLHGGLLTILGYQYYLDDIGILGFLTVFGLIGVLFLLALIIQLVKFYVGSGYSIMILILILYLGITSISVSLLNVQRITYLPFVLFMVSFFYRNGVNTSIE